MNKTVKNSAIYLFGTIIMGVLGFVNTMLLTRILSQQTYAMYGLLITFTSAVISFVSFGYDAAYMRFYYNHGLSQKRYIMKCLKVPLLIFLAFVLMVLEPNHTLITYIFESELSFHILLILLVYILFSFVHKFTQITARMEEYAGNYIISNIVSRSGFILFLFIIYYIFKNVTFDWVLISFMVGSIASVLINIVVFRSVAGEKTQNEGTVTQKDLFSYGFPYMINNVLLLVIPVIEKIIIRDLAGWEVLSIFTAASVFQTVVLMVINAVDNIWNPIIYKNHEKTDVFKPILHMFGLATTIVVSLGLSGCILLRRWLILILDSSYSSVYIIAPVVFLGSFLNMAAMIYGVGINIKKKTIHYIISPLLQLTSSVGLAYLLIPKYGLIGVGLSTLISIFISRLYRIVVGLKLYSTNQSEIKSIFLYMLCIVIAILSMYFTTLGSDIIMSLILLIFTYVVVGKDFKPLYKMIISLVKK